MKNLVLTLFIFMSFALSLRAENSLPLELVSHPDFSLLSLQERRGILKEWADLNDSAKERVLAFIQKKNSLLKADEKPQKLRGRAPASQVERLPSAVGPEAEEFIMRDPYVHNVRETLDKILK